MPDPLKVERDQKLADMKERAANTFEPAAQITSATRTAVSDALLIALPSTEAMQQACQRAKRRARGIRNDNTDDFAIPPHLQVYEKINDQNQKENVPFLLFDSYAKEGEAGFIDMTEDSDDDEEHEEREGILPENGVLGDAPHWYGDRTFLICPASFNQVFTLHARFRDTKTTISCLYMLLKRKDTTTYTRVFKIVKKLVGNQRPTHYLCDFEKAQIKGFHAVYPQAEITGCWFHLSQSVHRYCTKKNLKIAEDVVISVQVKWFRAMAYVKADDIPTVWIGLAPSYDRRLRVVVRYFQKTYIGTAAAPAQYDPKRWSVYERTLNDDPRSNNSVEAYHGALNRFFGVAKPTPLVFVDKIKTYHGKVYSDLVRLRIGEKPRTKQRLEWLENDARKRRLINVYEATADKIQYVKDMAALCMNF
uniref:MULE transposase domain-containing protein n=1 Tax=Panagrolaimus sp. JU765 TaxID=591449 RepID=A0AC34RKF9_9BILA